MNILRSCMPHLAGGMLSGDALPQLPGTSVPKMRVLLSPPNGHGMRRLQRHSFGSLFVSGGGGSILKHRSDRRVLTSHSHTGTHV